MTSLSDKSEWLQKQINMRIDRLSSHCPGSKRPWPQSDIEEKEKGLVMMEEIKADYDAAIAKRGVAA